jgi:hypothetical protein
MIGAYFGAKTKQWDQNRAVHGDGDDNDNQIFVTILTSFNPSYIYH